jgi:hypothetical protein
MSSFTSRPRGWRAFAASLAGRTIAFVYFTRSTTQVIPRVVAWSMVTS